MTTLTLSEILIYPVKSLAGIAVNHWPVTKTGLLYDRKWMLIDTDDAFLSQRKLPKMALIKTTLTESHLILSAPGCDDLRIPLEPPVNQLAYATVWESTDVASLVSFEADDWLSRFLETKCRLVFQPDNRVRPVDPNYGHSTDQVAFSDGFPFLIVSENSLKALNKSMSFPLTMARFRPNLVIAGCDSYAEDTWREIRIGEIDFRLPKPCSRCSVPAVDPDTAEVNKEPLTALNNTRKWHNKVYFGQNALHNQTGVLSVGDLVLITHTGDKQPPL
jgi:uncharacterized protein YcbX